MRTCVDERLRGEATRYTFRFACEDCAHADHPSEVPPQRDRDSTEELTLRCSLGYPPAPRRDALSRRHLELCKEFELGPP
jgi:hypothetical protein